MQWLILFLQILVKLGESLLLVVYSWQLGSCLVTSAPAVGRGREMGEGGRERWVREGGRDG